MSDDRRSDDPGAGGGRCGSTRRLFVSGDTNTGTRPGKSMDVPGSGRMDATRWWPRRPADVQDRTARPEVPALVGCRPVRAGEVRSVRGAVWTRTGRGAVAQCADDLRRRGKLDRIAATGNWTARPGACGARIAAPRVQSVVSGSLLRPPKSAQSAPDRASKRPLTSS